MHGIGLDFSLQEWFDFPIPKPKVREDFIVNALQETNNLQIKTTAKIVWLGGQPITEYFSKSKIMSARLVILL